MVLAQQPEVVVVHLEVLVQDQYFNRGQFLEVY
jgi:hypothetical protein